MSQREIELPKSLTDIDIYLITDPDNYTSLPSWSPVIKIQQIKFKSDSLFM